ncbi:MAG: Fic family protein, partial [Deltaproteobacteria bacterium]|nr:Fic family protein [Deltaproteobacteria bacterium]
MSEFIWQHSNGPDFTWDHRVLQSHLESLGVARGYLYGQLDALGFSAIEPLVDEAVTSAALEGERLSRREVRSSAVRHLGLDAVGLPHASRAVDGLVELLVDATTRASEPLTRERLWTWQAAIFPTGYSGLKAVHVGGWRSSEMEVVSEALGRRPHVHFAAPPPAMIEGEMTQLLAWFEEDAARLPGAIAAGIAHLWFETLHPFDDGNGRVGRALAEMALARADGRSLRAYSLSAQLLRERDAYYEHLESTQRGGIDLTTWLVWFCGVVARSVQASLAQLDKMQRRARFWRRAGALGDLHARQRRILDRLLKAGPQGFHG